MKNAEWFVWFALGYYLLKRANENGVFRFDSEDQTGNFLDEMPDIEDLKNLGDNVTEEQKQLNLSAFLAAIRYAEGTTSDEGYRALFGWRKGNGKTFSSFADHPRQFFIYKNLAGKDIRTSAAGAYQITATTFDALQRKYSDIGSFFPADQDQMAVYLIKERGALVDVEAGRFDAAIRKVKNIWASLPDSNVDQPTRNLAQLQAAFENAGGIIV